MAHAVGPGQCFLSAGKWLPGLIELVRRLAVLISCAEHSLQEIDKMKSLVLCLAVFLSPLLATSQSYDLVIQGGRVIDPETGLDAVRNVGVTEGKIKKISAAALAGKRVISSRGLVVAPGFIDLHQHAKDLESQRLKALDGVTTALEMEIGKPDVAAFLQSMEGHSLINYGTTASHPAARSMAFGTPLPADTLLPKSGPAANQPASPEQMEAMKAHLRHELDAGGLGVGMGIQYTPGVTRWEVIEMFRLAAERSLPVYTHVRSNGKLEPGSNIESVSEVIGAAAVTGVALHIVHIQQQLRRTGA
jgi:cytosine/adenosine deaminase-related metal-dependent hydrolase